MRIAAFLLLIVMLVGCAAREPVGEITEPGLTVVPFGTGGILLASEAAESEPAQSGTQAPDLHVQLPDEYLPSQAFSINLDLDDTEEQLIVFKRRDDPTDLIRILIVSFDPIRNNWIRAWEGVTAANNVRSFTLYIDDLIGDHEQEIVCFGINTDGEQTLDVFRRSSNTLGLGLAYTSILSVAADVNITIEELTRSEAFEAMEAITGRSYPVIVERRDPEAENLFDTIKTSYFWDFSARSYVPAFEERISGVELQDSRLEDLFAGTEDDFEVFLAGPWYRTSPSSEEMHIVFFGVDDRTIVFHDGGLHKQQAFNWDDSAKTVYGRGVQLYVTNETLRSLQRLISVSVSDLNRISVVVQDADGLDGTYERLSDTLQDAVLNRSGAMAVLSDVQPRGLYTSDSGVEMVFGEPDFTYRDETGQQSGGFVLFEVADTLILELKFIDENRLPVGAASYSVLYSERVEEDRVVRTMELLPGDVGLAGFAATGEDSLVLEQIEIIEVESQ